MVYCTKFDRFTLKRRHCYIIDLNVATAVCYSSSITTETIKLCNQLTFINIPPDYVRHHTRNIPTDFSEFLQQAKAVLSWPFITQLSQISVILAVEYIP